MTLNINGKSQQHAVRDKLMELLDAGMTDKKKMYEIIIKEYNVPRPSIRRIASKLRVDLQRKVEVLSSVSVMDRVQ